MKKQFSLLPKIAALSVMAAFAAPAMAQSAGSNIVNLGWFHFTPRDSSDPIRVTSPLQTTLAGSGSSVSNADTVGFAFTHFFTDNVALTADLGIPPTFKLNGSGTLAGVGELGSAKQWSPALVAKYYFGEAKSAFRPFVGLGITYVWYDDVNLTSNFQRTIGTRFGNPNSPTSANLSSSWAPVFNLGGVYNIDDKWSVGLSVSYIPLKTKAELTTTNTALGTVRSETEVKINPVVTFLSVGYKF
ncbi:OmpW family outer membrane protein [Herbaspirillum sp.]|uniref:OmpW/AlkL family protein n=1 Tax=Herbaspirillum sp. TaxID=1890675 RepID=UPI001B0167D8|nr:OmpW family outer membrane protein [Herbaspirillum sp.]MBO9537158.1 OmpW family protein [Herbaspirillum sp.]